MAEILLWGIVSRSMEWSTQCWWIRVFHSLTWLPCAHLQSKALSFSNFLLIFMHTLPHAHPRIHTHMRAHSRTYACTLPRVPTCAGCKNIYGRMTKAQLLTVVYSLVLSYNFHVFHVITKKFWRCSDWLHGWLGSDCDWQIHDWWLHHITFLKGIATPITLSIQETNKSDRQRKS